MQLSQLKYFNPNNNGHDWQSFVLDKATIVQAELSLFVWAGKKSATSKKKKSKQAVLGCVF